METFVPKPKQKFVKVVYKVNCPVVEIVDVVKVKNVGLPDKGQFFKHAGPNQVWVPRRSNQFEFVGHCTGEPGYVDFG